MANNISFIQNNIGAYYSINVSGLFTVEIYESFIPQIAFANPQLLELFKSTITMTYIKQNILFYFIRKIWI